MADFGTGHGAQSGTVGRLAGEQAGELLSGKSVGEVAPKTMENETFPCYNSEVLYKFPALTLPQIDGLVDVKGTK